MTRGRGLVLRHELASSVGVGGVRLLARLALRVLTRYPDPEGGGMTPMQWGCTLMGKV